MGRWAAWGLGMEYDLAPETGTCLALFFVRALARNKMHP